MTYDPKAPMLNEADNIPWSDMTTEDLKASLEHGDTVAEIAVFLQFSGETVRAKMKELGLASRSDSD